MDISLYYNYGYHLPHSAALAKLAQHGIDHIITWLGNNPTCMDNCSEHELYQSVREHGFAVDCALLPRDYLPYLCNTRYGRKDAIKAYKQYILSATERHVPMVVMDAAPVSAPYVEALQEICAYATSVGVIVCVRDAQDVDMVELLTQVDGLSYCLDTADCLFLGLNPIDRINSCNARLVMVLLADLEEGGTRLLPTTGRTDFAPILSALHASGYDGRMGILATYAPQAADADAFLDLATKL